MKDNVTYYLNIKCSILKNIAVPTISVTVQIGKSTIPILMSLPGKVVCTIFLHQKELKRSTYSDKSNLCQRAPFFSYQKKFSRRLDTSCRDIMRVHGLMKLFADKQQI